MTTVETPEDASPTTMTPPPGRSWRTAVASTEIDTRLLGMVLALIAIWIAFHVLSDGNFLTARNLWNLSVQSTSIAIMATGMVLIIVSRNIDLSVGSLLGFLGYTMALPTEDRYLQSKTEFEDKIAGLLGGNVAERLVFGDTTTGASNDIEKATDLARRMVTEFGMSDRLGPLSFGKRRQF